MSDFAVSGKRFLFVVDFRLEHKVFAIADFDKAQFAVAVIVRVSCHQVTSDGAIIVRRVIAPVRSGIRVGFFIFFRIAFRQIVILNRNAVVVVVEVARRIFDFKLFEIVNADIRSVSVAANFDIRQIFFGDIFRRSGTVGVVK